MDVREVFGARVRARRHELGRTQEELAEKAGLSSETISRVERGAYEASLASAVAIADALGVTLDALLGRLPQGGDADLEINHIISGYGDEARTHLLMFLRTVRTP